MTTRILLPLAAAMACGAGLALSAPAAAQGALAPGAVAKRNAKIEQALKLTPEQKTKILEIRVKAAEEIREKAKQINKDAVQKIRAVLTPEQRQTLDDMQAKKSGKKRRVARAAPDPEKQQLKALQRRYGKKGMHRRGHRGGRIR